MTKRGRTQLKWRWLRWGLIGIAAALVVSALVTSLALLSAGNRPADAYLVLGGSIRREMYIAEQAQTKISVPILISAGSQDPCIRLLFEQTQADFTQVWLEKCAQSTFDNFIYSLPILKQWGVHKIKLVTSGSHSLRALWMGRIMLGAHWIWVTPELVEETGVPGNQENTLKTILDISRGIGWALLSQIYQPDCDSVIQLDSVDLEQWRQRGFKCEHQAEIEGS